MIDFGQAAGDYAQYRPGFPDRFFERVRQYGIGLPQQRLLDLGCGTGTLALGFARRGCRVTGLDLSPEMLRHARILADAEGLAVDFVRARAEATPLVDACFDVVCAGQCWHWFDGHRAAVETERVLRPGGFAVLAYLTYLTDPGTLGNVTEMVLLKHNPTWPLAGSDGRMPFLASHLTAVGLEHAGTFEFDVEIPMTHAAWRGRFRTCNGVLLMPPPVAQQFDTELAELLDREYSEPLQVGHRIFAIIARRG